MPALRAYDDTGTKSGRVERRLLIRSSCAPSASMVLGSPTAGPGESGLASGESLRSPLWPTISRLLDPYANDELKPPASGGSLASSEPCRDKRLSGAWLLLRRGADAAKTFLPRLGGSADGAGIGPLSSSRSVMARFAAPSVSSGADTSDDSDLACSLPSSEVESSDGCASTLRLAGDEGGTYRAASTGLSPATSSSSSSPPLPPPSPS